MPMPKVFTDYSDNRNKAWCVHCGASVAASEINNDHIPSKSLLVRPYPPNLAVVPICQSCNSGFSLDEEYFVALLSAVLTGSTEPQHQKLETGKRVLGRNPSLRSRIDQSIIPNNGSDAGSPRVWRPETERIERVVVKNARGHAFFENGEPMLQEPSYVDCRPLSNLSDEELDDFFGRNEMTDLWPEVGSRWMQRLLLDSSFDANGFLVVQPDAYRFRLVGGRTGIRSVIHEYLATSVFWD